jgi:hypothetical protein
MSRDRATFGPHRSHQPCIILMHTMAHSSHNHTSRGVITTPRDLLFITTTHAVYHRHTCSGTTNRKHHATFGQVPHISWPTILSVVVALCLKHYSEGQYHYASFSHSNVLVQLVSIHTRYISPILIGYVHSQMQSSQHGNPRTRGTQFLKTDQSLFVHSMVRDK